MRAVSFREGKGKHPTMPTPNLKKYGLLSIGVLGGIGGWDILKTLMIKNRRREVETWFNFPVYSTGGNYPNYPKTYPMPKGSMGWEYLLRLSHLPLFTIHVAIFHPSCISVNHAVPWIRNGMGIYGPIKWDRNLWRGGKKTHLSTRTYRGEVKNIADIP